MNQEKTPVLIELEKALHYIDKFSHSFKWEAFYSIFDNYFGMAANQYQLQQPIAEPVVFEVGDTVETRTMKGTEKLNLVDYSTQHFVKNTASGIIEKIEGDGVDGIYYIHGLPWAIECISLVKKAEKPTPFNDKKSAISNMIKDGFENMDKGKMLNTSNTCDSFNYFLENKPFSLDIARMMYAAGGKWQEMALEYYHVDELKEKQLPLNIKDLEKKGYGTEYQGQLAATDEVLKLRQAWLDIEAPGWVPDWTVTAIEGIWIVYRCNMKIVCARTGTAFEHFSFPNESLGQRFANTFMTLLRTAFCLPDQDSSNNPPITPAPAA